MINAPEGTSNFDYTGQNFDQCTQTILADIADNSFAPIYYILSTITGTFTELSNSLSAMRGMFDTMRSSVATQGNELYAKSINITVPISNMLQKLSAMLGKTQGTIVSGMFTMFGGFIALNSLFLFIYELVVNVMYVVVAFIIACLAIGWMFPPIFAVGLTTAAFMSVMLIPVAIMMILMQEIFGTTNLSSAPKIPTFCFAGNTNIKLKNNQVIELRNVQIGDILFDGSVITACMKSTAEGSILYNIDNIIVTSDHKIHTKALGWINAADHPNSIPVTDFSDKYVYCLGTDSKLINIGKHIFSDWDEFNNLDMQELLLHNDLSLPKHFSRKDIHAYLDVGMHPDTSITMMDGSIIKITQLNIGDVLEHGEIITTIIQVKTDDVKEYYNILIDDQVVLSVTGNTEVIINPEQNAVRVRVLPPDTSYHVITNTGGFNMNGILIGDYNRGLDRFLSEETLQWCSNTTFLN